MSSYTARELERETGFDRRTIAYYVQERLLPRVGRRGPRTRYPKLVRDRLLFIRRVREAEEAGDVPPVSLSDMRRVFKRLPPKLIGAVADGRLAVTPELVAGGPAGFQSAAMPRAELEERPLDWEGAPKSPKPVHGAPPAAFSPVSESALSAFPPVAEPAPRAFSPPSRPEPPDRTERDRDHAEEFVLADALLVLQEVARRREMETPRSMDTWTRIEVSPDIVLSVRGITEEDEALVERVRRAIVELISRRSGGGRG